MGGTVLLVLRLLECLFFQLQVSGHIVLVMTRPLASLSIARHNKMEPQTYVMPSYTIAPNLVSCRQSSSPPLAVLTLLDAFNSFSAEQSAQIRQDMLELIPSSNNSNSQ